MKTHDIDDTRRDAKRYRARANECRNAAAEMGDEHRAMMLSAAEDYEHIAKTLENMAETLELLRVALRIEEDPD